MIRSLFIRAAKAFWLLPGFLLWASYPPMGETTDCLFALAPLLWVSRNADVKTSVRRWFANGFLFWFATLSWMPAIVKNGGPWPLVVLGWGALAAYCSLYFGAFGYLSAKYWNWTRAANPAGASAGKFGGYGKRLLGLLVIEPVLWAGLEIVRSRFAGGFAWNQLGVAPVNCGFGAPAALGGVYMISALVILVNGTLVSIAERMLAPYVANRRRKVEVGGQVVEAAPLKPTFFVPNWVRSVETLLPFLVIFAVYRVSQRAVVPPPPADAPVRRVGVAMVQRNFPCCFQGREENPYEIYAKLLDNVTLLRPDLVVLPESALCEFGPADQQGACRFADWAMRKTGGSVLAGGSRHGDGTEYNSAVLYDGREMQVYDKVHLVPFGEFIPGDKLVPALQKLAPVGSCTPGELSLLQTTDGVMIGTAICFEDTDSAQMRALSRMGAQVLFFITNDSWFSRSVEAVQHAWQARARAIETGLPVVRVGNSGVTGTILSDGKATWLVGEDGKLLVDARGTMFDRVAVAPMAILAPRTPYVLLGDWPLGVAFALLILAMILVKYRDYAKRRSLSL